jgi:hypothetical protein
MDELDDSDNRLHIPRSELPDFLEALPANTFPAHTIKSTVLDFHESLHHFEREREESRRLITERNLREAVESRERAKAEKRRIEMEYYQAKWRADEEKRRLAEQLAESEQKLERRREAMQRQQQLKREEAISAAVGFAAGAAAVAVCSIM